MNDLTELQEIWRSADTSRVPAYEAIMQAIRQYRTKALLKIGGLIVAGILLTCVMIGIVFLYRSVMVTTRIGEALMIVAGMLLVYTNLRSVRRLYAVKNHTNKEFAAYLEQVQVNRLRYYKRTQVLGLGLTFVALLFYVYEPVHEHLLSCIVLYAGLILYYCVICFIIRPRAYKRQAARLQETLNRIAQLEQQF